MWVSKLTCFLDGGQVDFVIVCGSKLLGFNVWIEIDLFFVLQPKMTCFSLDLVSAWVVEVDLVFV